MAISDLVKTREGRSRAQAAIFDGILFLLITALSVSMIFVFVNKYGGEQDSALRSAHMLNYVQSAVKELYYLRVETLTQVATDNYRNKLGASAYTDASHPYYGLAGTNGCDYLKNFKGPITVADLIKRDLADGLLDNRQLNVNHPANGGVIQPGKLALRCAMKEVMKPFTSGGFRYIAEFTNAQNGLTYPTARDPFPPVNQNAFAQSVVPDTSVVTDSALAVGSAPAYRSCKDVTAPNVANPAAQQDTTFVVAVPFRVVDTSEDTTSASQTVNYVMSVCIFQAI